MKKVKISFVLMILCSFAINCTPPASESISKVQVDDTKITKEQQIEYGKHLVEIMGCHDCHSPKVMTANGPQPDPARLLSGHNSEEQLTPLSNSEVLSHYVLFNMNSTASVGPWGTSFSGNLTPDETGLGNWTIENFSKAMREGKFKGLDNGRMLLPPMPWPNYSELSEEELAAIWAYLRSITPVKNVVPHPIPPKSL